jgi:[FeFe] hydrogenase H-cluster maturation GTPase HydF
MSDTKKNRAQTPHIGLFGRRNVGKSALINALAGQAMAIVSDQPGTTTDPVYKTMEWQEIGPVVLIDTAGMDDEGHLGALRVARSAEVIKQIDLGVLVFAHNRVDYWEQAMMRAFQRYEVPYILVHNMEDLEPLSAFTEDRLSQLTTAPVVRCSALTGWQIEAVREVIKRHIPTSSMQAPSLLEGLIHPDEVVVLVTPIDSEAPVRRLIQPQVMAIRDMLDHHAIAVVLQETELERFLTTSQISPALVVTDSQVFGRVAEMVPEAIPLTSFSILMARLKGPFEAYLKGTRSIGHLHDGDKILLLEACSHQINCEDIGRVKIPRWLEAYTGKRLEFEVVAGLAPFPAPVTSYALIIQCGGCMITRTQAVGRLKEALDRQIPVSNYGMVIAYLNHAFERAIAPLNRQLS